MMLMKLSCSENSDTSVEAKPSSPIHGKRPTAAEIMLATPKAERNALRSLSRFAASVGEYGFPKAFKLGVS